MKYAEFKMLKLKSEFWGLPEDTRDKLMDDADNYAVYKAALAQKDAIIRIEQTSIGVIQAYTKDYSFYLPYKNEQFAEALTYIRNLKYE